MNLAEFAEHPIQLVKVNIVEIQFSTKHSFDGTQEYNDWTVDVSHSPFAPGTSEIDVYVIFGHPEHPDPAKPQPPCKFRLTIAGKFHVNTSIFPEKEIELWAKSTGVYILYPYLREQVFAISTRVRMKPIILPLFKIPPQLMKVPGQTPAPLPSEAVPVEVLPGAD